MANMRIPCNIVVRNAHNRRGLQTEGYLRRGVKPFISQWGFKAAVQGNLDARKIMSLCTPAQAAALSEWLETSSDLDAEQPPPNIAAILDALRCAMHLP